MPGAELVGDPLPVPALPAGAHAAAVQVGEVERVAGVPDPPPLGVIAGQVGDVLGCRAEAGGAHHGAVAAGQAPGGDVVPVRGLATVGQQLRQALGRHGAAHVVGRLVHRRACAPDRRLVGCPARHVRQHVGPGGRADPDDEAVTVGVGQLRHGQVEPRLDAGAAAHRRAEARRARLRALHRDDERAVAPPAVDRIGLPPPVSTWSRMPTARTSHGRTPSRAYLGGSAAWPASTLPVARSADHSPLAPDGARSSMTAGRPSARTRRYRPVPAAGTSPRRLPLPTRTAARRPRPAPPPRSRRP